MKSQGHTKLGMGTIERIELATTKKGMKEISSGEGCGPGQQSGQN